MTMMKKLFAGFSAIALLAGGAIALNTLDMNTAQAQAQNAKATVDAAKARGEVGEQIDGYLGVVSGKSPSAAVKSAVQEINIGRKSVYTKEARESNVRTEDVAGLSGEKLVNRAPRGQMVKGAAGNWYQK